MRDLFFVAFLGAILFMALRRPYLFILTYCYVDIVAPQRLSFMLLNKVPISLILFGLALLGWFIGDNKKGMRFDHLQVVLLALLVYCGISTMNADFPIEAAEKWGWVWKALLWSMFLPLVLRTRLRIEALVLVMVLSAATLAINGGMKTALGGSGYGSLKLLLDDNSGLFEGSIFSTVAISIIPLILWLARYGTIFKPSPYVWAFAIALVGACLLIPIGTQARTGLVCAVLLALLAFKDSKHKVGFVMGLVGLAVVALPFVPSAFSNRMDTITNYQSDESASTRVAVWKWTWEYALDHPMGGGFEMYRQNQLQVNKVIVTESGGQTMRQVVPYTDKGRAFHNSYFEMLGEQGFPGLLLWLYLQVVCIFRMEKVRRRYKVHRPEDAWVRPFATALQGTHLVYLLGGTFVGIAFLPFIFMVVALQIGLHTYLARREQEARWRPLAHQLGGKVAGPDGLDGTPAFEPGSITAGPRWGSPV